MHSGQPKLNVRCKRKAPSGLEGVLEIVDLEVMEEGVRGLVHIPRAGGKEFQIVRGATKLKLRSPINEVRTNGTESRLVYDKHKRTSVTMHVQR